MSFDFSTLVTDRTQADVNRVKQIAEKIKKGTASESDLSEFNSAAMKGAYNYTDLNRVTAAMEALKAKLEGYGYAVPGYQRIKVSHPVIGGGSRLPEGYTELAWIESTGTQCVDTGFMPNQDTRVVMDCELLSFSEAWSALFSTRSDSETTNAFAFFYGSSGNVYDQYGSQYVNQTNQTVTGRRIVDKNKNITTADGLTGKTFSYTAFTALRSLLLFADGLPTKAEKYFFSGKIYSCQIYDNGVLVRDFVPCKNSGGVFGLYDMVNDVFYQNAGSGAFTAGEEIVAPATASVMVAFGDVADYDPYTWYEFDWPTPETMTVYLLNVSVIRSVLDVMASTPKVPSDMVGFMTRDANDIETILLDVYRQLVIMPTTFVACGEAFCGGDNL